MCIATAETPKQDSLNKANRHPHPSARCDCPSPQPTPSILLSHGSLGVNTFANFTSLWFILKFFPVIQRSSFTWCPMSRELLGLPQTLCLPRYCWQIANCQCSQHLVFQTTSTVPRSHCPKLEASLTLFCLSDAHFSPSHVFLQSPGTSKTDKYPVARIKLIHTKASFYFFYLQDKVSLNRSTGHTGSNLVVLLSISKCSDCCWQARLPPVTSTFQLLIMTN